MASAPLRFIYNTHIVPCVSEEVHSMQLYVEVIKIESPNGIEPLEALRQACQKNGELSSVLLQIVYHMCTTMHWRPIDSMHQLFSHLFSLGSDVGAYDITNEGNILSLTFSQCTMVTDVSMRNV